MDVLDRANIFDTVNFTLYERTQNIIRTDYNGCKILGKVDAATVKQFGTDPYALHANVYGTLPAGVPQSADDYLWLKVRLANGKDSFVGLPYIIPDSLVVVSGTTMAFYVENCNQEVIDAVTKAIATTGNAVAKVVTIQ